MDVWCFEDNSHHSSSSSGSLPQIPFNGYLSCFSCIDDNFVTEIPPVERVDCVQFGDSELLNSSTMKLQGQLDKLSMLRGLTNSTCQTSLDILHEQPQTKRPIQSNLFYLEQSLLPGNKSYSFDSLSSVYTMSDMPVQQTSSDLLCNTLGPSPSLGFTRPPAACYRGLQSAHPNSSTLVIPYARFSLPVVEKMAITRAMVSVISSSSSSSLSSSSAVGSYQHPTQQGARTCQSQVTYCPQKMCSFQPYHSSISRKLESHNNAHSQNMIKKAHNMLRSVNKFRAEAKAEETQLAAYQMQHMVLERRRRERLNSCFHSLGKLLPPGSKKDKTTILCKTVSYMKTLKSEIYELEVKNQVPEEHVLPFKVEKQSINPNERVQVKLGKSSQMKSEKQQIDLVIMVRVQCDLIVVVLHVLECIKTMKAVSLLSLDAIPNTEKMKLFATLKLAIEVSTWDERTFTEAVTGAAHMGLSLPA